MSDKIRFDPANLPVPLFFKDDPALEALNEIVSDRDKVPDLFAEAERHWVKNTGIENLKRINEGRKED